MFTQCPECKTVFRVTPEQLGAASGKVRCSRCNSVFNASENLFAPADDAAAADHEAQQREERDNEQTDRRPTESEPPPSDETPDVDTEGPEEAPLDEAFGPAITESESTPDEESTETGPPLDETFDLDIPEPESAPDDEAAEELEEPDETEAPLDETFDLDIAEPESAVEDEAAEELDEPTETEAPLDETFDLDIAEPESAPDEETAEEIEEPIEPEETFDETFDLDIAEPESAPDEETAEENEEPIEPEESFDETFDLDIAEPESAPDDEAAEELEEPAETEMHFDEELDLDTTEAESAPEEEPSSDTSPTESAMEEETRDESGADELLGEDLFDLFNDEQPAGEEETEIELPLEENGEPGTASNSEEKGAQETLSSPADWDPFSEENIEALLTPSDDAEELELNAAEQEGREVELSSDELDLSADDTPEPAPKARDADDELLNQRLPEDDVYHELELEEEQPVPPAQNGHGESAADVVAPPSGAAAENYSLPIEQQQKRSIGGALLWGSGILLLLAGLALQYLYYHRNALAENPGLRPLLAQMCQTTGCTLPPRRALDKIELADHLMQFHPRYRESLLITATLVNRADFSQPFPVVEVVMTDLQQKVIARRHFRPEEYLIGEQPPQGFVPNTEIPLMLEVVDPGETAVGFEFNFY